MDDTLSYSPLRHLWKFWQENKISTRAEQGCLMCVQLAVSSARAASWGSLQAGFCPSGALCQLQYVLPYRVYKVSSWTKIISLFLTAIFNLSLNHQKKSEVLWMLYRLYVTEDSHHSKPTFLIYAQLSKEGENLLKAGMRVFWVCQSPFSSLWFSPSMLKVRRVLKIKPTMSRTTFQS